jgi:Protein tyrosine and serine/threonine kinase
MLWRAPELLQDDGPNTNASDVYAFAMVCYEVSRSYNCIANLSNRQHGWQMFSGQYPFSNVNQLSFPSVLMQGNRPSRPSDAFSAMRGLNDAMWDLVEACWSQEAENRPDIDHIVDTLYLLPQRTDDLRPMDDFNITQLSSQMWHKQEHHPFFALSPVDDNLNDDIRRLKWMSGDVDSYA